MRKFVSTFFQILTICAQRPFYLRIEGINDARFMSKRCAWTQNGHSISAADSGRWAILGIRVVQQAILLSPFFTGFKPDRVEPNPSP